MKRLYDLDPAEVSLVPRGANRKKFLVFKSHKGNMMAKKDSDREIRALIDGVSPETMKKVEKILKTMTKKSAGDMPPRKDSATFKEEEHGMDEHEEHKQPLSERAQAALKAVARIMAPFKDELTSDHVGAVAHEVGLGGAHTEPADEKTPHDEQVAEKDLGTDAIPENVEEEHHAEALALARKAYGEHLSKLGYRKYPDAEMQQKSADDENESEDDEEEESVGKVAKSAGTLDLSAFPKEQRSQLESVFKAHQELVATNKEQVRKIADLEKELSHERDLRVTKEFTERAQGFKHLGANTEKLAKVLKTLAATDEDAFKEVESVLKTADRQLGTAGLFGERGSKLSRSGDAVTAEDKLQALVDQVVEKSGHEMTSEQAYEKVLKTTEGKRLYAEYKSNRPGGI